MGWLIAAGIYLVIVGVANIDFASEKPSPYAQHWLDMGDEKPTGKVHRTLSFAAFFIGAAFLLGVLIMAIF
jgi:hypothetical protein